MIQSTIKSILEELLCHQINKVQAIEKLAAIVLTDRLEEAQKEALNASVQAIYFRDSADYLSFHYNVVSSLTDAMDVTDDFVKTIYDQLNPDDE